MKIVKDQVGRTIHLPERLGSIISLVPSITELLAYWQLDDSVEGITKFCIHPDEWYQNKTRVGGTKKINMSVIHQIAPDLIIANKEENTKEMIRELEKFYPVWVSDPNDIKQAVEMIYALENLLEIPDKLKIGKTLEQNLNTFTFRNDTIYKVAYLIWKDPYMVAANKTYIHSVLEWGGFRNVYEGLERYPAIELDELKSKDPDLIFLSSEPYPFKQQNIEYFKSSFPRAEVYHVEGEYFSWYGSRMLKLVEYLTKLRKQIQNSSRS